MLLLTGGTGFVGGHLLRRLRVDGRDVRCLVRDSGRAAGLDCELAEGDVTDPASLRRAVDGCDTVIHLVAIRQGRPEEFERVMTQATRDLVSAAEDAGVKRFVLMSALGTSEASKDLVPYYGAKWEMERAVQGSGLRHVIFRPSFVFARDGGILPTFRRIARLAPVTPIPGAGRQRIQPIWIDDVAEYFARSLDLDAATDRTFELGGPDVVSWNELWERLKRALGVRRPSLHVPMPVMRAQAVLVERLPGDVPLTRDLLKMLEDVDNVVSNDDAVTTFQIPLVPLDEQLRRAA
jgi:uncharacterized protein YbjT (DUF2867 family)